MTPNTSATGPASTILPASSDSSTMTRVLIYPPHDSTPDLWPAQVRSRGGLSPKERRRRKQKRKTARVSRRKNR